VPVVWPNRRDARLHTAAVILSIHAIGITALDFRVSVPQIVSAIVTAGLIDVALTYRATGKLVWPASGMLTGSGVALILRLVGIEAGDYWSWTGWHWFALVAGVSILTKYLIRLRGSHVFNPSNVGLVLAFLLIGSDTVEPLDFWWAPLGFWMIVAYVLILGGGILITRRLYLLEMAVVFWVVLAVGLGVLSASGHCMIASWSTTPVCDMRFWTALVTSPEILIFLFFMITDPKTIPTGRSARVVFAATLAVAATLLIAPHGDEFGAKVGLLSSLALWSPMRGLFERGLPAQAAEGSGLGGLVDRLATARPAALFLRGSVLGVGMVLTVVAIVAAGAPARSPALAAIPEIPVVDVEVDPDTLPAVVVDLSVHRLQLEVDDEFVDFITVTLAENLALEAEAMRTADGSILGLADGGLRLDQMRARLDTAIATGERWADEYHFDSLSLALHEREGQESAGLLFTGEGRVDRVLYDVDGGEVIRSPDRFASTFLLRQLAGERWLLTEVDEG
jgi:hypothetical protein